jgi:outer membrane protein TolC
MRNLTFLAAAFVIPTSLGSAQATSTSIPTPLTLAQAIELGRQRGVNAALARLNITAADAKVGQRRADLLPTIDASGAWSRQTRNLDEVGIPFAIGVTPDYNLWYFQAHGSQTLFNASLFARYKAAVDSAQAAGFDAQGIGELAASTAGQAYLQAISAHETVRAREADSTIAASLLDQARQLVAAGVSPVIDETRSSVNFAAVKSQLLIARNERDRARLELARVLELTSADSLVLADSLGMPALDLPRDPAAAVAFAIEHRAETAAEQRRTTAMTKSLKAIRYENLPNLSVGAQAIGSGRESDNIAFSYNYGVQLSVPILDGWKRPMRYKEQEARLEAQRVHEQDVALQVEVEARQALLDLASAEQQVAVAKERLQLAEQELAQAEERFRAGVAGSVETTNAQGSVFTGRNALIQAKVNYGTARVAAYRALGVLNQLQ